MSHFAQLAIPGGACFSLPSVRITIALLLLPFLAAAENIAIRMEGGAFRVTGWTPGADATPSGWESIFSIYAGDGDLPPMLGSYAVERGALVFRPRLPVLFDPGRIKRGLLPLNEVGPAIEDGKRYTLVIDREWLDARGVALREEFRKQFRVGPADRTPPDPAQWRLTAPKAGTSDAL